MLLSYPFLIDYLSIIFLDLSFYLELVLEICTFGAVAVVLAPFGEQVLDVLALAHAWHVG
jgi:hypothetical protein